MPNPLDFANRNREAMGADAPPLTVDAVIDKLLAKLSLREKTMIANIPEESLENLYHSLDGDIQNEFRVWLANAELLESCRLLSKARDLNEKDAIFVIIKTLWDRLQQTNVLRIVK